VNTRKVMRAVFVVAVLVLGASAVDALPAWLAAEPDHSIGIELASLQSFHSTGNLPEYYYVPRMVGVRFARLTGSCGRVRLGVAAVEGWSVLGGHDMAGMGGFAPLYLDVNLYRATRRTGRLYWNVPDVYVSTTFIPFSVGNRGSIVKAGLTCDVDYFGVGVGLEAAYTHGWVEYEGTIDEFGIGIRLRVGVASIRVGN